MNYEVQILCANHEAKAKAMADAGIQAETFTFRGTDTTLFAAAPALGDLVTLNLFDAKKAPTSVDCRVVTRTFQYSEELFRLEIQVEPIFDIEEMQA